MTRYGEAMDTTQIRTMPHFRVTTVSGETVDYARDVWQRKNIVLIVVPEGANEQAVSGTYVPLAAEDTRVVVTSAPVTGVSAPAVLIADQWGEVAHAAAASTAEELPGPGELLAWLEHVRQRCPECEGEAR
jgi:hypothetical protein